jgi:hypothetical protein
VLTRISSSSFTPAEIEVIKAIQAKRFRDGIPEIRPAPLHRRRKVKAKADAERKARSIWNVLPSPTRPSEPSYERRVRKLNPKDYDVLTPNPWKSE